MAGGCCGLDRRNADDCRSGSLDAVTGRTLYTLSRRHLPLKHPAGDRPEMGRASDVRGRRAGSTCRGVAAARILPQDRSSYRLTDKKLRIAMLLFRFASS